MRFLSNILNMFVSSWTGWVLKFGFFYNILGICNSWAFSEMTSTLKVIFPICHCFIFRPRYKLLLFHMLINKVRHIIGSEFRSSRSLSDNICIWKMIACYTEQWVSSSLSHAWFDDFIDRYIASVNEIYWLVNYVFCVFLINKGLSVIQRWLYSWTILQTHC